MSVRTGARSVYFCGRGCVEKFEKDPKNISPSRRRAAAKPLVHLQAAAPGKAAAPAAYICPMCQEVKEPKPGACPSCGMALEPESPAVSAPHYVCPMHPEIVRNEPGSCPICGMSLEPQDGTDAPDNPELRDMTRRFWVSVALTAPLMAIAMRGMAGRCRSSNCLAVCHALGRACSGRRLWCCGRVRHSFKVLDFYIASEPEHVHADISLNAWRTPRRPRNSAPRPDLSIGSAQRCGRHYVL